MRKHSERVEGNAEDRIGKRLAAYMAAMGAGATLASTADGAVVANTTRQPIGINGEANIDFNSDGLIDFQLDHDRYNLNGTNLDYLQVDKNDVSSAADPLPIDGDATFPVPSGVTANGALSMEYLQAGTSSNNSFYPAALNYGEVLGPTPAGVRSWTFQESENAFFMGYRRSNRLLDEDHGQMDASFGKTVYVPTDTSEWVGTEGEINYLGLRVNLNSVSPENAQFNYGWAAVRITNEADATAELLGFAYDTVLNTPIPAGEIGVAANADYDDDGDVDGNDFLTWQRQLGSTVIPKSNADGTGDGLVNAADLAFWRTNYASATVAADGSATVVPEPASLLIGGTLLAGCAALKLGRRKSGEGA